MTTSEVVLAAIALLTAALELYLDRRERRLAERVAGLEARVTCLEAK